MAKPHLRGTANGRAKITPELVRAIRAETATQKEIAAKYNLSPSQIGSIRRGDSWSHVDSKPGSE